MKLFFKTLTSKRTWKSSVVAHSWPSGAPIELQSTPFSLWGGIAEVWTAAFLLGTALGDGTLSSLLHPPPHP